MNNLRRIFPGVFYYAKPTGVSNITATLPSDATYTLQLSSVSIGTAQIQCKINYDLYKVDSGKTTKVSSSYKTVTLRHTIGVLVNNAANISPSGTKNNIILNTASDPNGFGLNAVVYNNSAEGFTEIKKTSAVGTSGSRDFMIQVSGWNHPYSINAGTVNSVVKYRVYIEKTSSTEVTFRCVLL